MKIKGIILVVLSAVIYGSTPVLCSWTYALGNNPYTMTFFRSLFAIPFLFCWMKKQKITFSIPKKDLKKLICAGVFGACLTTLLLYSSYHYISIGTATTLHFIYPVFVLLISIVFYKDTMKKSDILVILVALLGVGCFMNLNESFHFIGIALALSSGITYAYFMIALDKQKLSHINHYQLSFYLALIISAVLLVGNLFTKQIIWVQPIKSYLYIFVVSISTSVFAMIFFKEGIFLIGASRAAIFSLFEPLSSIFLGVLLFGTSLTFYQICGCCLILLSVILLIKFDYQN